MNKKFLFVVSITIVIITTHNANAQIKLTDSGYYVNPCNETIFIRIHPQKEEIKYHSNDIDIKAIQNFHNDYPAINNERWYKSSDGGYIANFITDAVHTTVAFNSKGRLHHTINYYDEKGLPHDVWDEVKSVYYAYNIFRVAEIHFNDQKVYMVYVENETSQKTIRVTEDNIEEVESFKKG